MVISILSLSIPLKNISDLKLIKRNVREISVSFYINSLHYPPMLASNYAKAQSREMSIFDKALHPDRQLKAKMTCMCTRSRLEPTPGSPLQG